jgi:hypothetical protein
MTGTLQDALVLAPVSGFEDWEATGKVDKVDVVPDSTSGTLTNEASAVTKAVWRMVEVEGVAYARCVKLRAGIVSWEEFG